jgi:hypothetical protein
VILFKRNDFHKKESVNDVAYNGLTPKEIECHLHEQFAINNNANTTSFIAFLTALIAVFGGYGYVFYNYMTSNLYKGEEVLLYTTIAVHIVLCILYAVAIVLGEGQRSNQFVVDNIRLKAYGPEKYKEIFPGNYNPHKKCFCKFIPGIYNVLSKTFFCLSILLSIFTLLLVHCYCCYCCIFMIPLIFMFIVRCYAFNKYQKKNSKCK